eukprot:4766177-Alexandrium_andersonii.AAC.1
MSATECSGRSGTSTLTPKRGVDVLSLCAARKAGRSAPTSDSRESHCKASHPTQGKAIGQVLVASL